MLTLLNSSELLLRNLLRLCETHFPKEASRTVIGGRTDLRLNLERQGYLVQFQLSPRVTILSKHLLQPACPDINLSKDLEVPDIAPLNSVANFEEQNIYDLEDYNGTFTFV